jgi:4-hydroxybenzoate polyprenyltransferase
VSVPLLRRTLDYGRMIRFSHSVFALPFALTAVALAARGHEVSTGQVLWIVGAMVTARSAAMGFNRLADRALDAENARTARRELPQGILGTREVTVFVVLSAVGFVVSAAMLNPLCLALSPVALAIVLGYSYTKRFTSASHLVLGLALAVAPVGAWLAIRGRFELPPLILGLAVLFWVAGFDTVYACQDVDFDRERGLHSLPARLGIRRSLVAARGMHSISVLLLLLLFEVAPLHLLYLAGVLGVAVLLTWQHSLVRADDLSRVMPAFNLNGWVSLGYFACTAAAAWLVQ